ncbi:MAG: bifunctional diaminohydroxyphosphoribosylaminopyrimidine deaminase/5-amino-6-(5-phosphoribosylamino)uracil reductase RibD [Planctomycetota bacterium]
MTLPPTMASPPPLTPADRQYLSRALDLAQPWAGATRPNPAVGCVVLASDGTTVVGEGWHEGPGLAHAEAMALERAGEAARGGTAYVTLEPCNHTGRTPPCSQALIAAGVVRVVYLCSDAHPEARGGARTLRAAGVAVQQATADDAPDLMERARLLVAPFMSAVTRGRPFVVAKWAMTLDGRIATHTGDSRWVSGEAARAYGQELRASLGAIAVGAGTLRIDDPLLTYRGENPHARQPLRVVFGGARTLTMTTQQLLTSASDAQPVLIVMHDHTDPARLAPLQALPGVRVMLAPLHPDSALISLTDALPMLTREHGVQGLLLEGGSRLLGSAFDAGIVDRVSVAIAPKVVGGDKALSPIGGDGVAAMAAAMTLRNMTTQPLGGDWLIEGDIAPR